MPRAYRSSLWCQCYDLRLPQLVRSRFSNFMCPKNEVSWLPEYTERPGCSISGFFSTIFLVSLGSNWERVVQGAWDISITHGLESQDLKSRPQPHWESLGCTWKDSAERSDSPIIPIRSLQINIVTVQKLIETMPRWMSAIVRAKDGPTKYI